MIQTNTAGILLSAGGSAMERLFDLDMQLLHDAGLMILAVFFLFLILSYALFNPVRKMLADRRAKIEGELKNAKESEEAGEALKAQYEAKLAEADKEVQEILADARKRALAAEAKTLAEAREEAARIREQARRDAELEKRKASDQVRTEIVEVATLMAEKLLAANIDAARSQALLDETIEALGRETWLNQ